jgi:hypothetical protein
MAVKSPSEPATAMDNVVLSWRYADGRVVSGHFLPRERAEQLARVYGDMHPDQTYWIEAVPLVETQAYARVRRRRFTEGATKGK